MYVYSAKLSYDEEIFEKIETQNFQTQSDISEVTYNADNNKFVLVKKEANEGETSTPVSTPTGEQTPATYDAQNTTGTEIASGAEETLMQIKLKVKDNAKAGSTIISLNSIKASDGEKDTNLTSQTAEVEILSNGQNEINATPTTNNQVEDEDISVKVNAPNKGLGAFLIILMLAIAVGIVWFDLNKNKENKIKAIVTAIGIVIILLLLIPTIKNLSVKSTDVDSNGVVNEEDTQKIIDYLLEIERPEDNNNEEESEDTSTESQLDTNSDGRISATDIARAVRGSGSSNNSGSNYRVKIASANNGSNSNNQGGGTQSSSQNNNQGTGSNPSGSGSGQAGGSQSGGSQEQNPPVENPTQKPPVKPTATIPSPFLPTPTIPSPGMPSPKVSPEIQYSPGIGTKPTYNQTPQKGEELTVDLEIEITPFEEVTSVIIEGKEVPVEHIIDGIYRVKVPMPQEAGVHDVEITGVVLKNGKTVNAKYKFTVDVLKTIPEVKSVEVNSKVEPPEISVDVKDEENAITGGKITVKDKSGKIAFEKEITKDEFKNKFKLEKIEKDVEYEVTVETYYDLDSNKFGDIPANSGSTTYKQAIKVNAEYGFQGANWSITPEVTENDNLIITFENSFNSYYDVKEILVAGKTYEVTKEGNTYKAVIDKSETKGKNTIKVEKVTLKNGESFDANQELTYIYLKNKPSIGGVTPAFAESNLNLTFDIQDKDNAITKITVYLTDEAGNLVAEKDIEQGKNSVDFAINGNSKYKARVEYTYDLGKGEVTEQKQYDTIKLKKAPTATVTSNVIREPNEEGVKTISATYEITDEDNTIIPGTLKAILKNPQGEKIATQVLNGNTGTIEFNSETVYDAGTYTIEILANYEIEDGKTHKEEPIGQGVIAGLIYATIEKIDAPQYVNKSESFELTYTIKSNTTQEPTGIEINGQIYPIEGKNGTYKVELTAKDTAEVVEYKTTRIIYQDAQISSERTTTVEVLKSTAPQVSALSFDGKSKLLTFNIVDPEDTYVSGKVILTAQGKAPIEMNLTSKENISFELKDLEEFVEYNAEVIITYDFDSNKGDKAHQNEVHATGTIELIEEYDFELTDFKLDHIDPEAKKIYVTFVSENASKKFDVSTVDINGTDYEAKVKDTNGNQKTYIVEIPYEEETKNELVLQEAILQNLQGFKNGEDFTVEGITVFKLHPTAVAQAQISENKKSITVQVAVTDEELISTDQKVRLVDNKGNEIETKPLDNNEITFTAANEEQFKSGKYKVEVLSTFDAVDGNTHKDEVIGTSNEVEVEKEVQVISEKASSYYVQKDTDITITYEIASNTDEKIQKLVVNGEELPANNISGNTYEVTVHIPQTFGTTTYNLSQIIYSEEDKIDVVGTTTTVDVLRTAEPKVNDISVNDEANPPVLSFNIEDPEETFVKGKIKVQETGQEIEFESLQDLNFELTDIQEFQEYNVEISLTYNLCSNKEETTYLRTTEAPTKTFSIIGDYGFNLEEYKVRSVNKETQTVTLEFKATLNEQARANHFVDTVKINGTTYENVLQEENNTYTVEIPYNGEDRQEFNLEEAILNNLHKFIIEDKTAVIFKKVTAAIVPNVSSDITKIDVTINMADSDEIAENIKLKLIDSNGNEESKDITRQTTQETFDLQSRMSGTYTIKIVADFDAVDGAGYVTNREVSSQEVTVPTKAIIDEDVTPKYVQKNQEFDVTYTIRTNTTSDIQTVVVNEVPCTATKQADNKYLVKVTAPETAGDATLAVSRINYEDGSTATVEYTSATEVLKSEKPNIANIKVDDQKEPPVLSYDLVDPEETFVAGEIIIKDTETNQEQKIPMQELNYVHELQDIRPFTKYDITFNLTYDLDKNKNDTENQDVESIAGNQFEIIKDYNFRLENFQLEKVNREEEKIELSFESSNASEDNDEHEDYYVSEVIVNDEPYSVTKGAKNEQGLTKYTFSIPYTDETRKDLTLQKAKLNNFKEFENLDKHVIVFKTKPVSNITAEAIEGQTIIKGTTNIVDSDTTLTALEARLLNPKTQSLSTKPINVDAKEVEFTSPETGMFKAGEYELQIFASYNTSDGQTHELEKIGETKVTIATKARVVSATVPDKYVDKTGKVGVKFEFESNNDIEPTGINYGETYYELTKQEDNTYLALITPDTSSVGEKSLTVTVAMYNGETVVLDNPQEVSYYVLKDKPTIENYTFNQYTQNQTLEFSLKNPDNVAFENAEVVLEKDGTQTKKQLNTVVEGETANTVIDLKDLEDGEYKVNLSGTYDRTDSKAVVENLSELFEEKTINIKSNYEEKIEITKKEVKNNQVDVTFESKNLSGLDVKKVVVNGQEIEVTSLGNNTYKVSIPLESEDNQTITIEELIVDYEIRIKLTENNSFEIFKKAPTVTEISAESKEDGLHVHYTLTDEAGIAGNLKAKINGIEKPINDKASQEVVFGEITQAGTYTIEFIADYNAEDGKTHEGEKIGEYKYTLPITAQILSSQPSKQYAEKNEDITIKYVIQSNTTETPTALKIEGIEGDVALNSENQITVNVGDTAGKKKFNVTHIKYGENEVGAQNTATTTVLKTKPQIKNYKLNIDSRTITFDLEDPDGAVNEGSTAVIKTEGEEVCQTYNNLQNGTNTIELSEYSYNDEETYKLTLQGTYNRLDKDSDLSEIFEEKFQLKINTKLAFDNFSTHYPERGKPVDITFNVAETNTSIPITAIYVNGTEYPAEVQGDKYKITYTAQGSQGIEDLSVDRVKHGENEADLVETISDKLDILKKKPRVILASCEIDEDYENKKITFKFTLEDEEDAILKEESGQLKAYLNYPGMKDAQGRDNVPLVKGENTVVYEKVPNMFFRLLTVTADYDLDTDELNDSLGGEDANQKQNDSLIRIGAGMIPPTDLHIDNIQAVGAEEGKYLNKGQEYKLSFTAQTFMGTPEAQPLPYYPISAMINGTYYELEKVDNTYTTKTPLEAFNDAGEQEITIESVTLNNHEKIEEDTHGKLDVLKDQLTLQTFEVNTDYNEKKATAKVELNDSDGSFVNGKIVVRDTSAENAEPNKEFAINKETQEYDLKLTPFKKYEVTLLITTDLDSDQSPGSAHYEEYKQFGETKQVELITDYKLQASDFKVIEVNKETNVAKLQFKATNASSHKIAFAKVADKDYAGVGNAGEENTYTFDYNFETNDRKEIKLEKVKLEDNTELEIAEDLKVTIFKTHPTVEFTKVEAQENMKVHAEFNVTDTDSTLTNLYAVLKDKQGNEKNEQTLETNAKEVTFEGITEPGDYQVVIKADYNAVDGEEHNREIIQTSDQRAEIKPNSKITNGTLPTKYPEKGQIIEITYEIASNIAETPTKLTINDQEEIDLISTGKENEYKISYKVPEVAGVHDIEVTKIHYANTTVELAEENQYELQVDVLKAKPTYTVTKTELLAQKSVVFQIEITDDDEAMKTGTANVHEENVELRKGSNMLAANNIQLDTEHSLEINIEYDLDSNELEEDEPNKNVATLNETQTFTLVSDYGLEIKNLRAVKKSTEEPATYVNKNDPIELRFTSTNKTELKPIRVNVNDTQNSDVPATLKDVKEVPNTPNEYSVELMASTTPGKQQFEITAVELAGSVMINNDKITFDDTNNQEITVLKEIPQIEGYTSTNQENSVTVKFTVIDPDNALKEGSKIKLLDSETSEEVQSATIHKDENTHTFTELEPGKKYTIEVENNYSLSEDGQNDGSNPFKSEPIEITKKEEPNFKVKHLEISKRVPKGGKVEISFENAVMSYKDVDHVTIDSQSYAVNKDTNGVYKLQIDPAEQHGINKIQVQTAEIGDKSFPINRPLSYTNEYANPSAEPTIEEIEEDGGKAKIKYKLQDEDKSVRKLTLYMKATSGAVVAKTDIEEGNYTADNQTENSAEISLLKLTRYKLELRATCDIGDGKTLEEKSLFEMEKYSPSYVAILENSINTEYAEKGEEVELTFKISTNVDGDAKKIYVNGDQYTVEKVLDEKKKVIPDTYKIKVEAPTTSGVFEQEVTAVEVGSELMTNEQEEGGVTYSSELENNKVAIKVLKDTPTVSHFNLNEKDGKVSFKVNDLDEAWLDETPARVVVKKIDGEEETEVGQTEIEKKKEDYKKEEYQGSDFEIDFNTLKIDPQQYPDKYTLEVYSTFDRRPDSEPQKISLWQRIMNFFTGNKNEVQTIDTDEPITTPTEGTEESPTPEPEEDPIKEEKIFTQNMELVGSNKEYKIDFEDYGYYYLFSLRTPQEVQFECSTGTDYKVSKVIFEGQEFPVEVCKTPEETENGKYRYKFNYVATSAEQYSVNYEKIILENGASFDVEGTAMCMVIQADPTFNIKTFTEDLVERKVRFGYKFVDDDEKLKGKLRFTLCDSQGTEIGHAEPERTDNLVEFNIPDPPTAVYQLKVEGDIYQIVGYEFTVPWLAYEGTHNSSCTTSIRSSVIENPYPKKGETIDIIYNISSTKVVRVDKEDHSNQDKAVGISKLVINDKEYDVETLDPEDYGDEKYRIYYTAKDEEGLENIKVSKVIFTNGEEEEFEKEDQIEVLKDEPKVTNYSSENKLDTKQITFKFKVEDPDNVIVKDEEDIYAEVDGQKEKISMDNENNITFTIPENEMDTPKEFNVKATYDLDGDQLKTDGDKNNYTNHPIFTKPFVLTGYYGVNFEEVKTYNSQGEETNYFEKNSDIKLTYKCSTKYEGIIPETVTINGENHPIEKMENGQDLYTTTIKASDTAGKQNIKFESVTLNSGNVVPLENQQIEYEVLKDQVTVENFSYKIGQENSDKIDLQIKLKDDDGANTQYEMEVVDENGQKVEITKPLETGDNNLQIDKTGAGKYFATIYSTYDRDLENTNFKNQANKERIHYEIITVNTRYIEMKDIVDIELYKYGELRKC